jgi:adenylate cyclase
VVRTFRVAGLLAEPNLNRITAGDRIITVEPKVMEVLACLAGRPGEVFSKGEIMEAVWPDTHVGDEVLRYSVSELRKALGDEVRNPRFIQTIARRGYRLIAPVRRETDAPQPQASIAVLAFTDMSPKKDQEFFCDGTAEEIINSLTRLNGLRVASRTSAFAFKGKAEDVRNIGRQLGVATVLEGSVRKSGQRLRITAQLINVDDGYQLWSARYDSKLKDAFAVQDEIARSIAATLRIKLTADARKALVKTPPSDPEAYDYYLRGKQFYYQFKRRGVEFALKMFSHAIELDPGYARAHAGVANCCTYLYMHVAADDDLCRRAVSASQEAVELDPESAECHVARGTALSISKNHAMAGQSFESAIRLDPTLFEAYYYYARDSFMRGDLEKAIALYEKASEIDPEDYQPPLLVAQIYADLGRKTEAEAARRRGVQAAEARLKLNPDDSRALYMCANGLVALGEYERGLEWAAQALALDPTDSMVLYNVACIQSMAGKVEDALDSLEAAVNSGLGWKSWIEHDSNLENLRKHRRYRAVIRALAKVRYSR